MMKQGEIVALDSTRNLLDRFQSKQLKLRLSAARLPDSLLPHLRSMEDGYFTLALKETREIVWVLAELRSAGIIVEDLQLTEADLEDVFVKIVGKH
jgi:ABC-2 type transport system ATP-binding protein